MPLSNTSELFADGIFVAGANRAPLPSQAKGNRPLGRLYKSKGLCPIIGQRPLYIQEIGAEW